MTDASIDSLRHQASQNRTPRRSALSKLSKLAISAVLAVSVCGLPATTALAEQVLEVPRVTAPTPAEAPMEAAVEPDPVHRVMAPMPSGVGSVNDYETQDESSYLVGATSPSISRANGARIDPSGNRQSLTNEVILGAVVIGLFALEAHSANQRRHR
jgi:hypothetical protein